MPAPNAIPVILGPTASGKTSVGLRLAHLIDGEIISIDSRKVYKGLRIGTATPTGIWKEGAYVVDGIPHHLTDFLDPAISYTAGNFAVDAARLIDEIRARGRVPILVGGTGFYFKALQQGLPATPPSDPEVRERLMTRLAAEGAAALHAELARIDPPSGKNVRPSDTYKILRALEVCALSDTPFSGWKDAERAPSPHAFKVMGIDFSKEMLDRRIEERSAAMEKGGMIDEAAALMAAGYAPTCPALASFGYKEAVQVIRGEIPRRDFLPLLIKGTRAYAKRQRTWFRTQVKPLWFACNEKSDKDEIAAQMKALLY